MKCFKNSNGIKLIAVVLLAVMTVAAIVGIIYYDQMSMWPMFASAFFVLVSILTIICLVYMACKPGKDDSAFERQYRFRFGLNVFSLSLCILVLIAVLLSSTVKLHFGEVNATDFYTAFIALCTTFVVGFQIYNSIDLNKKIDKLDADKKELEEQLKNINKITKRCEYFNAYTVGAIRYNESGAKVLSAEGDPKKYCWNAMKAYFNALRLAAEGGQNFHRALKALDGKIRNCINMLSDNTAEEAHAPSNNRYIYNDTEVKTFVITISRYIENTQATIKNAGHIDEKDETKYGELVSAWGNFISEVKEVVKF